MSIGKKHTPTLMVMCIRCLFVCCLIIHEQSKASCTAALRYLHMHYDCSCTPILHVRGWAEE
jgi:hypothetical protein